MTTHTDLRILKLLAKGLTPEQIARKIGRPTPEGLARVERTDARRRRDPERRAFIMEEMRQTGCLAIEAARRFDQGEGA